MAENPGLLVKPRAGSAEENDSDSAAERRHSDAGHSHSPGVKLPRIDEFPMTDKFLEDTLVKNRIETSQLLTKREAEILKLIVSGKTNKEIGRILCRTRRTVEYHRNRLMRKLGAHSAADLVKRAITMGLL